MDEQDIFRLKHIVEASHQAMQSVEGKTPESLLNDTILTLGLVKCIEIIGEASTQITDNFKSQHPELPWQDMRGMRNRLVHAYFDVDINTVWITVKENLPPMVKQVEQILRDIDS